MVCFPILTRLTEQSRSISCWLEFVRKRRGKEVEHKTMNMRDDDTMSLEDIYMYELTVSRARSPLSGLYGGVDPPPFKGNRSIARQSA